MVYQGHNFDPNYSSRRGSNRGRGSGPHSLTYRPGRSFDQYQHPYAGSPGALGPRGGRKNGPYHHSSHTGSYRGRNSYPSDYHSRDSTYSSATADKGGWKVPYRSSHPGYQDQERPRVMKEDMASHGRPPRPLTPPQNTTPEDPPSSPAVPDSVDSLVKLRQFKDALRTKKARYVNDGETDGPGSLARMAESFLLRNSMDQGSGGPNHKKEPTPAENGSTSSKEESQHNKDNSEGEESLEPGEVIETPEPEPEDAQAVLQADSTATGSTAQLRATSEEEFARAREEERRRRLRGRQSSAKEDRRPRPMPSTRHTPEESSIPNLELSSTAMATTSGPSEPRLNFVTFAQRKALAGKKRKAPSEDVDHKEDWTDNGALLQAPEDQLACSRGRAGSRISSQGNLYRRISASTHSDIGNTSRPARVSKTHEEYRGGSTSHRTSDANTRSRSYVTLPRGPRSISPIKTQPGLHPSYGFSGSPNWIPLSPSKSSNREIPNTRSVSPVKNPAHLQSADRGRGRVSWEGEYKVDHFPQAKQSSRHPGRGLIVSVHPPGPGPSSSWDYNHGDGEYDIARSPTTPDGRPPLGGQHELLNTIWALKAQVARLEDQLQIQQTSPVRPPHPSRSSVQALPRGRTSGHMVENGIANRGDYRTKQESGPYMDAHVKPVPRDSQYPRPKGSSGKNDSRTPSFGKDAAYDNAATAYQKRRDSIAEVSKRGWSGNTHVGKAKAGRYTPAHNGTQPYYTRVQDRSRRP